MSSSSSAQSPSSQLPASYSLHLTQLPYDATELDIRRMFSENGITSMSIHSVRMVYDHDVHTGRKTVFRGVAFADMKDVEAYNQALKLNHRVRIRGRKLNIRPTKTKQQLAEIVVKTREKVQETIRKGLAKVGSGRISKNDKSSKKNGDKSTGGTNINGSKKKRKKDSSNSDDKIDEDGQKKHKKSKSTSTTPNDQSDAAASTTEKKTKNDKNDDSGNKKNKNEKDNCKTKEQKSTPAPAGAGGGGGGKTGGSKKSEKQHASGVKPKLTKKERNRKAQIILQGIRKGRQPQKFQQRKKK